MTRAFLIFCLITGSTQMIEAYDLSDIPDDVTLAQFIEWTNLSDDLQQTVKEVYESGGRRLSGSAEDAGPCAGFDFSDTDDSCAITDENGVEKLHPELNPSFADDTYALSEFARDWIRFTCCKITKADMHGIIASVWLWLQVCTQAMTTARENPRLAFVDDVYASQEMSGEPYTQGPLRVMYSYCPDDLDGGQLSEWVVATFFPVMEAKNQHFSAFQESLDDCEVDTEQLGAVTVLFTAPEKTVTRRTFGHIAMVIHNDRVNLDLPDEMDTTNFLSWSNQGNTVGAMITGTKALHVGFGVELQNVTNTVTLYNVDTAAMLQKWNSVKTSGQMFDLMDWNCARTLFEVLNEGYTGCQIPEDELWTPERAFSMINTLKDRLNEGAPTEQVSLEAIHARQIVAPVIVRNTGIDAALVIGISLACFFGTLILAATVATVIIMKIKAEASKELDRNLANLLISAAASAGKGGPPGLGVIAEEGTSGPPSKKKGNKNSVAPIPLSTSIQAEMDVGTTDGTTDYAEFMKWAKDHGFNFKQAKILWQDLDRDHNNHVTNKEWEGYIDKRPNLKWLATRLQSVQRK